MYTTRTFAVFRPTLLATACVAAFTLSAQALAYDTSSFAPVSAEQTPDWSLLVGDLANPCTGTVITPRVVLTAPSCVRDGTALFSVKNAYLYDGKTKARAYAAMGLLLGDKPLLPLESTAPILSYAQQRELLKPGLPFTVLGYNADPQSAAVDLYSGDGYLRRILGYPSATFASSPAAGIPLTLQASGNTIWTKAPQGHQLPFTSGDAGAGIFAGEKEGGLIGMVAGHKASIFPGQPAGSVQTLLFDEWPLVYAVLMDLGMRDDAVALSRKVLGTGEWGENDYKGTVGQIYVQVNPDTQKVEFFRLATVDSNQQYWRFPTNQQDNQYWQYLGDRLPTFTDATTTLHKWSENDQSGKAGDIYIFFNHATQAVEFFRLKSSGTYYVYFPVNRTDNDFWEYLGTELPYVAGPTLKSTL